MIFQGSLNIYHLKDQVPVKHYNKLKILIKWQMSFPNFHLMELENKAFVSLKYSHIQLHPAKSNKKTKAVSSRRNWDEKARTRVVGPRWR